MTVGILVAYSTTAFAEQEVKAEGLYAEAQQEPSKRMTQRLYELYHYYFWENLHKQAFEGSEYGEQYIKDAEAVIDQFCRHLSSEWNNQFLKNPNPPMAARATIELAGRFLERYESHESLSFLIACNLYFAPGSRSYPGRCNMNPDLIRGPVEQLITDGYPRFVEIYGRSFLRHVLLRSRHNKTQTVDEARAEAFEQHGIMVDTVYGLISEGCEAQPKGLDEQALFEAIKYFWCQDQDAFSDVFDRFNREFALLDKSLDKPKLNHPWLAFIFQAYYHNETLIRLRGGLVRQDENGKYYGLTHDEHLQAAILVATSAWEMYPDRPHAAFFAMNVSMMGKSSDTVREWFNKGHEANGLVIPGMYGNYCHWLMRRGDDYDEMLKFVYRMVDSGRFDTAIPDQMYWAMARIYGSTGDNPYFKHDGFYEHFKKYCEGRSANPTDTKGKQYWMSAKYYAAAACGLYEEASKLIKENGGSVDEDAASVLRMSAKELLRVKNEMKEFQKNN